MPDEFLAATRDRPVHPLVTVAEPFFPTTGSAIDLGCGAGAATLRLLERGLAVTAVDESREALDMVAARAPAGARLELVETAFERLDLGRYDVACAILSLFFMTRTDHDAFWSRLVAALEPGGVFVGHFMGVHDDWCDPKRTAVTRTDVDAYFAEFTVLGLNEQEIDAPTALDVVKHWHLFHVIARKR